MFFFDYFIKKKIITSNKKDVNKILSWVKDNLINVILLILYKSVVFFFSWGIGIEF